MKIELSNIQADIFKTWLLLRLEEYHIKGYSGTTINLVDILTSIIVQLNKRENLK